LNGRKGSITAIHLLFEAFTMTTGLAFNYENECSSLPPIGLLNLAGIGCNSALFCRAFRMPVAG